MLKRLTLTSLVQTQNKENTHPEHSADEGEGNVLAVLTPSVCLAPGLTLVILPYQLLIFHTKSNVL